MQGHRSQGCYFVERIDAIEIAQDRKKRIRRNGECKPIAGALAAARVNVDQKQRGSQKREIHGRYRRHAPCSGGGWRVQRVVEQHLVDAQVPSECVFAQGKEPQANDQDGHSPRNPVDRPPYRSVGTRSRQPQADATQDQRRRGVGLHCCQARQEGHQRWDVQCPTQ